MANEENLKAAWIKGESGNPKGRPKGSRNRSTIAKKWLNTNQKAKNPITGEEEILTQEDLIYLAQLKKARNGDKAGFDALIDSAYGKPVQQIDQHITEQPLFPDVQEDESDK